MELTRHYAKACDLADFDDPELAPLIAEIAPGLSAAEPHRKGWEFAMTAAFLRDAGVLREDARILDVGAGSEPIVYWLANRCGRIIAVDVYGRGSFGEREATRRFLENPASFAPYDYPRERLEVRDMDARSLEFEDGSFDAVFSLSSIEHFGGPGDIARSAGEIGRVLKPGGMAFVVTELLLKLSPLHRAPVAFAIKVLSRGRRAAAATVTRRPVDGFRGPELRSRIVAPSRLRLLQPLELTIGDGAWQNVSIIRREGTVTTTTGRPFPHIVVGASGSRWTSVCLPLRKPA